MDKNGDAGFGLVSWADSPAVLAAAHELKSPLVLVRQLALELAQDSGQSTAKIGEQIAFTAERSLRMVEQLTRSARLQDALFETEPVNLADVASDVASELAPMCKSMGQRIVVRPAKRSAAAIANKELLKSVLVSLCDNAMKHNQPKGIVQITTHTEGESMVVAVRDSGPWVKNSAYKNLRKNLGTNLLPIASRPGSSGLGLAIAGVFAERMNGKLMVTRHRQYGLTFSLALPVSKQLSLIDLL